MEYVSIDKVYSSKLFGDFAGGNVDIVSKDYKGKGFLKLDIGSKINTNATAEDNFNLQKGYNSFGFGNASIPGNSLTAYNFNTLQLESRNPIGGSFGGLNTNGAGLVQKSGTSGALGAGIMPMIMSSYVQFLKAEAILTLGIGGDAKTELLGAIGKSIDRVVTPINNFPLLTPANLTTISSKKTAYLNFISSEYDLLTSDEKLELIIKEYYLASWGNGIEPYNNYRRTGYPSNFQPTLELNSGSFYYTAYYPANASSNNPNTPQSLRTRKVFWDKANLNLH